MGFLDLLQSIAGRAGQEWQSSASDALPNPLAGFGLGPAELHYNPLANVPVLGGLINRTVNAPLHAAGLINEAAGNVGQAGAGEIGLLAALAQAHLGDPNSTATQAANAMLAQGPLHPGRALEAARTGPDTGTAWLAGALDLAMNPLNYAGPVGELGAGLRAAEQAPRLGSALETLANVLHAGNMPAQAGFSGLAGLVKGPGNVLPAIERSLGVAAPDTFHAVQALDTPALVQAAGAGDANALARLQTIIESGGEKGNVGRADLLPGVGANGRPGLGPLPTPEVQQALDFFAPVAGRRGNVAASDLLAGVGANGKRGLGPLVPPGVSVQSPSDLLGAAQATAQPSLFEQLQATAQGLGLGKPALPEAPPLSTPLTPAAPPEAITAAEEAAAKAAPEVPDLTPPQTPAPDLPSLEGTRRDILAGLTGQQTNTLLNIAYDHPNAIRNAQKLYPDPVDLREAALRRIQTGEGSTGKVKGGAAPRIALLNQRDPQLAQLVAALPDEAAATADNVDIPAPTPAPLRPLGGDIAAGGGGMGIVPYVLPAPVARALLGGGVGGAVGGAIGATQTPDDRMQGFTAGALGGGALGAAGALAGGSAPYRAILKEGAAALGEAARTGESVLPEKGHTMGYIRSLRKTGAFVVPRNALGAMGNVAMAGGDLPTALRYAGEFWGNLPQLLPALRAAGTDEAAKAAAMYQALPADIQRFGPEGVTKLMAASGSAYERNAADLGAANVHPLAGAARGAVLGIASPRAAVIGAPSLLLGAAEGATLPARAAMQNAFATAIDVPARVSLAFPAYEAGLAAEAPGMIARVAAVDPANAALLDRAGTFDPGAIKDPTLAAEWANTQSAIAAKAGELATDRMGDFTTTKGAAGIFNSLFPGGVWNVQQAAVLARAMADHPAAALGALGAMVQDYRSHLERGDPQHAGTWELTDRTPGFGLLVRAANGGGPGSLYVNPLYPFSPFSGETLNLPREIDPLLNPGQNLYDRALKVGNALGLGVNPEIAAAMYKEGASSTPMSDPLRLAPVGQYLDAKLGSLTANPLAQVLSPDGSLANLTDINQQLRNGRYLDPAIARAGAELIYDRTHKPASDPSNAPLLAQLRDPTSALHAQALERGLGGPAAAAALNEAAPTSGQAESTLHGEASRAEQQLFRRGIPFTKAQIQALASGDRVTASQGLQAALDAAKEANPILRVNDAASPEAQAQVLLNDWRAHNAWLSLFPALYQQQLAFQGERLGLNPAGSAAAAQQAYDTALAGRGPGLAPLLPGGPPPNFDPSRLYELQRFLNGGR